MRWDGGGVGVMGYYWDWNGMDCIELGQIELGWI